MVNIPVKSFISQTGKSINTFDEVEGDEKNDLKHNEHDQRITCIPDPSTA
jgi:hypothetical protein